MSEEEKNAIKCLELDMLDTEQIDIIINLIDKQQKEIERLSRIIKSFESGEMKVGEKYE